MSLDSSAHNTAQESWKSLHVSINKCLFLEERKGTSLSPQRDGLDRFVPGTNSKTGKEIKAVCECVCVCQSQKKSPNAFLCSLACALSSIFD